MKNEKSRSDIINSQTEFKVGAVVRLVNPTKPTVPVGHRCETPFSGVYSDISVRAFAAEDQSGGRLILIA